MEPRLRSRVKIRGRSRPSGDSDKDVVVSVVTLKGKRNGIFRTKWDTKERERDSRRDLGLGHVTVANQDCRLANRSELSTSTIGSRKRWCVYSFLKIIIIKVEVLSFTCATLPHQRVTDIAMTSCCKRDLRLILSGKTKVSFNQLHWRWSSKQHQDSFI